MKYKFLNCTIILFICFASLAQVYATVSLSNLLNSAISKDIDSVLIYFLLIFVLWILYSIFELIHSRLQSKCISKMNNDLRAKITESISAMTYEDFDKNEIGAYVSWYTNDMIEFENSGLKSIYSIIYRSLNLIFVLLAVTEMHYIITLTMIVSAAVLMISPKLFNRKIEYLSINQSTCQENFTKNIKDALSGFTTLKLYNSLNILEDKTYNYSSTLEDNKLKLSYLKNNINFIIGVLNVACQLSCSFVATYLVSIGSIQAGTILAVGSLSGNCFNSIKFMLNDIVTLASGKKIFEKLTYKDSYSNEDKDSQIELKEFNKSIEVVDLTYSYGERNIFNNLNLSFEFGKKYAIIGKSGCGKSTLLKILTGSISDYDGEVKIDDINMKDFSLESIYNNFAYIDQNVYLFNSSILNNITVFKKRCTENLHNALENSALAEFIDEEKLNQVVGEQGKKLSGGQRQRISIARALINKKKVIIMDEGTSSLDKENSYAIEKKLLNNPDITLIIVTHNLNENLVNQFDHIYNLNELNNELNNT
ncbi:MAG: ABC transporter ATP-binding protein [Paraclostridium sordellii]